ncbi:MULTISPECIES: NUDIX hydrolase [Micromonospora]|uniref:8-oxo-dGTP diphosphatase n=1 Tax=Micromonospora rifamycinica TaxID=291594 RepID=A0A109INH8_9ACTN|nr:MULTISPECIES: NUDIX domain-containing protein [Micromonospora]KWV33719.1 DNA hydrolase [Micromonospora rifamycinica]WFE63292.1 NUDIX domain-containing protein [Micromonospora sp. WMMD714]WFE95720.1 NUDIX domain-containing protein [Micromonospora sp. WMMD987]SCG70939.1 8-oxo-dGTP diphosphatase [Micromonospora rifamycinica]
MNEQEFLAGYDPSAYPSTAVTVDVVALTIREGALHLLLIRRGQPPYQGHWALPGGFVQPDEDLTTGARRELAEETGLGGDRLRRVHLEQLASYGSPDRDPRMRIVSVAHLAFAPDLPDPVADSDADEAGWLPVTALPSRQLAFDHARIVDDGLERARSKLEYTPLATRFLGPEFTIAELRGVYETVWGHPLHAGNFHRKVLSVPGFVESTGVSTERGGTRGGPRARLYRAGDARLLHPALLRPAREETVR